MRYTAAALTAIALLAATTHAQTPSAPILVILKDQPARQIAASLLSPAVAAHKLAAADLRTAPNRLQAGQDLWNTLAASTREIAAEIRAVTGPEQDLIAARLSGLGGANIRRYTVLNMLQADLADSALDIVKRWPEVAEVIPVGSHQALLDQVEQSLTTPAKFSVPILTDDDEAFSRLLDRIADDRDALFASPASVALNLAPAADYSLATLSTLGTFAHLPVKAAQLNGPNSTFLADSLTVDQPYRLYRTQSPDPVRSILAWDRHFGSGLEPTLTSLDLYQYKTADGTPVAAATAPSPTVRQLASTDGGDQVIKVRLTAANEPFALATSATDLHPAQGPKLAVKCTADCLVNNDGDLPAFDATAMAEGAQFKLGTIAAGSSAWFTPGRKNSTAFVNSQSFGEMFTASTGGPDPCMSGGWQFSMPSVTLDSSNNWTATVSVTPPATCTTPWMAWFGPGPANQALFVVSPVGTFISGPGSVTMQGDPHPPISPFSGTLYITQAELATPWASLGVTDVAGGSTNCTYSLTSVTGNNPTYTGGSVSIAIASQSGCTSNAASDSPLWATSSGATSGTANWTAMFTVAPNVKPNQSTTSRTANLTISGSGGFSTSVSVQQSGLACTFKPGGLVLPAAGIPQTSPATLSLTTNPGCQWTAVEGSTFVHLIQTGTGVYTNSGTIQYWADANTTGSKRTGDVQIGGTTASGDQDPQTTPNLTVVKPQAGDTYHVGDPLTVEWSGAQQGSHGDIVLVDRDGKQLTIQSGVALDTTVLVDWKAALPGTATGANFKVNIVIGGKVATSGAFNIIPVLSVAKPAAGDVVLLTKNGKPNQLVVVWNYNGPAGITGQIDLIGPDGKVYTLSAAEKLQAANKSITKPFPNGVKPADGYKIRITPSDNSGAVEGGSFTISNELAIAQPTGNPTWVAGTTYTIKVTGSGLTVNVYVLPKSGDQSQKIQLKTAADIPDGGLTFDWPVPATLAAGNYVIHADEVSSSNGQSATAPFTVQSKTFHVQGKVIIPTGTQFANLAGCTVTIQQRHADGSLSDGVTVKCDDGTWSADLDRVDSSGKEITYQATPARTDYQFTFNTNRFTATTAGQSGASFDFTVRVIAADVSAVGANGLAGSRPIPATMLIFLERTSQNMVGTAELDPNLTGAAAKWTGTVPEGAIQVTASAPDGTDLRTGPPGRQLSPILAPNVVFVGTEFSASGVITVTDAVKQQIATLRQNGQAAQAQALQDAAWAAIVSATLSFTQNGNAFPRPDPEFANDQANLIRRWTAYGFDTAHNYRVQAKLSAPGYKLQTDNQPISPKGAPVNFVVEPGK